jgi:hypothetical protein
MKTFSVFVKWRDDNKDPHPEIDFHLPDDRLNTAQKIALMKAAAALLQMGQALLERIEFQNIEGGVVIHSPHEK